jgi:hypothetical protein
MLKVQKVAGLLALASVMGAALVVAGCARLGSVSEKHITPNITLKETLVCKGRDIYWPMLSSSPNGAHTSYVAPCGGIPAPLLNFTHSGNPTLITWFGRKYEVIVDGVEGRTYPSMDRSSRILYSPDSQHLAFVGHDAEGKGFVVLDGVEGKHYDAVAEIGMWFSDDSKHLPYYAVIDPKFQHAGRLFPWMERDDVLVGGKYIPVMDGVEGKPSDEPYAIAAYFSPDGKRTAYPVKSGGKWSVILDGVEGKQYDEVAYPQFSPDSKHFAYQAKSGGKECIILDGVEGEWCNEARVVFSSSSRVACILRRPGAGGNVRVVLDGVPGKEYYSMAYAFVFSPDGLHYAYPVFSDGKWFIVLDGVEGKTYDGVNQPTFSPDSAHFAYIAGIDGKTVAVLDGVEGKPYKAIDYSDYGLVFSPDSKHLAYLASLAENEQFIVLDGLDGKHYMEVAEPRFSPDSQRLAYVATTDPKHKSYFIVVDGKEQAAYDYVRPPVFSPDSKHLVYYACRRDVRIHGTGLIYHLVADGVDTLWEYDEPCLSKTPSFASPNKCQDIVRSGWNLYRVEIIFSE